MEALSKIQDIERILQLLEDETSLLKDTIGEQQSDLSEFDSLEARNKEALALIQDLESEVEALNQENIQLKEVVEESEQFQEQLVLVENENDELKRKISDQEESKDEIEGKLIFLEKENDELKKKIRDQEDAVSGRGGKDQYFKGRIQEKLVVVENENDELKKKVKNQDDIKGKLLVVENENVELRRKIRDQEDVECQIQKAVDQKTQEIENGFKEKLIDMENENANLQKKIKDLEDDIRKSKLVKSQIQQALDRKVEEIGKGLEEKMEANIIMIKRRIRIAEQLQTEDKETFARIKETCVLEHFDLDKRVQLYSKIIATTKKELKNLFDEANVALLGLESSVDRFGEKEKDFLVRIGRISDEIIVVKDWIQAKKEEEKTLRLLRKIARLEKNIETKEEAIFELVEEKKEVIRQLSFCIEYHRTRYAYRYGL